MGSNDGVSFTNVSSVIGQSGLCTTITTQTLCTHYESLLPFGNQPSYLIYRVVVTTENYNHAITLLTGKASSPPPPLLSPPPPLLLLSPPVLLPPSLIAPPPPAIPAPSYAAALGLTVNTFHTGSFSATNVDMAASMTPPSGPRTNSALQWYFFPPFYTATSCHTSDCVAFNPDGSVTLTNTQLYGARIVPNQITQGIAFGGGAYFEATISYDRTTVDRVVAAPEPSYAGWPAFWALSAEYMGYNDQFVPRDLYVPSSYYGANVSTRVQRGVEMDFMEQYASTDLYPIVTLHDGSQDLKQKYNDNGGWSSGSVSLNVGQPTGYTGHNRYGFLWVPSTPTTPGYGKSYFNGVAFNNVAANPNFQWPHYDCTSERQADYANNTAYVPFSVVDCQHMTIIFDTGLHSPMTIYNVNVWQSTDANNLHFDVQYPSAFPAVSGVPS